MGLHRLTLVETLSMPQEPIDIDILEEFFVVVIRVGQDEFHAVKVLPSGSNMSEMGIDTTCDIAR